MSKRVTMHFSRLMLVGTLMSSLLFGGQKVSLDQLIRLSLEHSPDIKKSNFDVQNAQKQEEIARGDYLPTLDAYAGASKGENKAVGDFSSNYTVSSGVLAASQLLYDFGKTKGFVDAKGHQLKAMDARMQRVQALKIFNVKKAYYASLKRSKIINVQEENVKLNKQQLFRATKYFKAGIKTKVDVSDANLKLTRATLALKNAEYDKLLSITELIQVVGYIPKNNKVRLAQKKIPFPYVSKHLPKVKGSLRYNLKYAYKHRCELKFQDALIEAKKSMVVSSEGDYYPTLSLDGSYINNNIDSSSAFELLMHDEQWKAGVNLSWNLYEGGKTDNRIEVAKIDVQKAKSIKDEIMLQVKRDVTDAYLMVKRAKDAVVLSESMVTISKEKHIQSQKRYENDFADFIELQEAQNDYIVSLTRITNAYYDYFISLAYLNLATGKKYAAR